MRLYLDSMLWIYFFEKNPQFHPTASVLIERNEKAGSIFVSSHLILAEVLVIPKRNRDNFTSTKYRRFFH
jgi:predicted nucleic acid-binding protein